MNFDLPIPQIGFIEDLPNTISSWADKAANIDQMELIGLMTIGLAFAVIIIAVMGAMAESKRKRIVL